GVCLMVAPEHLNWHLNMDEYTEAKTNLFASQIAEDIAIYFGKNELSQQIASASSGQKVPYFTLPGAVVENGAIAIEGQYICDTAELKLLGEHNWQNACAAVTTVWQITQDIEALRSVLTNFTGLEHRLELVRELDGVKYYDDSFGTTPETAIVALQALEQPKIIILGGSDKGASYDGLAQVVTQSNVQTAILVGDQAGRIKTALEAAGFTNFTAGGSSMTEIVAAAQSAAQSGDVVLLSPACASFGMFKDYKDRGEQFKSAVQQLAGQPG
ncbi:MAG TPA: UDP-N-acetylmuramoyl-L-alanine--D-glutamate ligase, partial [Methylomirabilota bacterium]|nr:UDP-N-acetylmuramoyl-L-alanine--D-glutamate ligase [Methylomirabilota bacterium]